MSIRELQTSIQKKVQGIKELLDLARNHFEEETREPLQRLRSALASAQQETKQCESRLSQAANAAETLRALKRDHGQTSTRSIEAAEQQYDQAKSNLEKARRRENKYYSQVAQLDWDLANFSIVEDDVKGVGHNKDKGRTQQQFADNCYRVASELTKSIRQRKAVRSLLDKRARLFERFEQARAKLGESEKVLSKLKHVQRTVGPAMASNVADQEEVVRRDEMPMNKIEQQLKENEVRILGCLESPSEWDRLELERAIGELKTLCQEHARLEEEAEAKDREAARKRRAREDIDSSSSGSSCGCSENYTCNSCSSRGNSLDGPQDPLS